MFTFSKNVSEVQILNFSVQLNLPAYDRVPILHIEIQFDLSK